MRVSIRMRTVLAIRLIFFERLEKMQANEAEIKVKFSFLENDTNEALSLMRQLDKDTLNYRWKRRLILNLKDPIPIDLLPRSSLVRQKLSRMNINILSLLDKTVEVTLDVIRM